VIWWLAKEAGVDSMMQSDEARASASSLLAILTLMLLAVFLS